MKINWNKRTYTEQEFRNAWLNAKSIADVARALGLTIYGSTYGTIKDTASALDLTREHFTGAGWRKGLSTSAGVGMKFPIEFYLVEGKRTGSTQLKKRLIEEGFLPDKCSAPFCPVPNPSVNPFTGESKELKLALDHINGNHVDNRIENLRLLCYHCHGETTTFAGSNQKRKKKTFNKKRGFKIEAAPKSFCLCGAGKGIDAKQCRECFKTKGLSLKITATTEEILDRLQKKEAYDAIGRDFGVSGNAIKALLIRRNITPPKSQYGTQKSF